MNQIRLNLFRTHILELLQASCDACNRPLIRGEGGLEPAQRAPLPQSSTGLRTYPYLTGRMLSFGPHSNARPVRCHAVVLSATVCRRRSIVARLVLWRSAVVQCIVWDGGTSHMEWCGASIASMSGHFLPFLGLLHRELEYTRDAGQPAT